MIVGFYTELEMPLDAARALVLGSNGQTASYLIADLISQNVAVAGVAKESQKYGYKSSPMFTSYTENLKNLKLVSRIIEEFQPTVIVNLASASSVFYCQQNPEESKEINAEFVINLLDLIEDKFRFSGKKPRFIQASSSEMYSGNTGITIVDENTPLNPGSIYGEHKAMAHQAVIDARKSGKANCQSLIFFNHESPRRSLNFVSRKITSGVVKISRGMQEKIHLGNLDVLRDWGFAGDYSNVLSRVILSENLGDFVIGSGKLHSVRDFCRAAFSEVGILDFENYIEVDNVLKRNFENDSVVASPEKAVEKIGWKPSMNFQELVAYLVTAEANN